MVDTAAQVEAVQAGGDTPQEEPDPTVMTTIPTSWEFFDVPTTEEVIEKLKTLPDMWGIRPEDFVEFVQPLSQTKNVSLNPKEKEFRQVWTLYFTVAGRIAMLNQAAVKNGWRVDFTPEPNVPSGNPAGYVEYGDRIVYREYVHIWQHDEKEHVPRFGFELGKRPGTAWVPGSGGANAVASNRFEKVETSARGRAIAAWGIGVLPGSGVASLDEMQGMPENRAAESSKRQPKSATQPSRAEVEAEVLAAMEEYRQLHDMTEEQVEEKVQAYLKRTFDKEVQRFEGGAYDFRALKPGEVALLRNRMQSEVQKAKNEKAEL